MKTKSLLRLSLATAILGTLVIAFLANSLEPPIVAISSINERLLGEWVKIQGRVIEEREFEKLRILTLDDSSAAINALLREKINSSLQGSNVTILGKVTEYRNELQIEIYRIITRSNEVSA